MRTLGVTCLPPIEKEPTVDWFDASDAFAQEDKLKAWITSGLIGYIHFGTECKSFSTGRRGPPGPRPIRDRWTLKPIDGISASEYDKVVMGDRMADFTFRLAILCTQTTVETPLGRRSTKFSVENPATSMPMPDVHAPVQHAHADAEVFK